MSQPALRSIAGLLLLVACAGDPTQPGSEPPAGAQELADELAFVGSGILSSVIDEKARLRTVEFALVSAAARYCGSLNRPRLGAFVGGGASIEKEWLRTAAQRDHAIEGNLSVLHVVPGGPSHRAGLKRGDEILSFHDIAPKSRPELLTYLNATPELSIARVRIRRDGADRDVEIEMARVCPVLFELGAGPGITPWQHGKLTVVVPRGLLQYAEGDDDVLAIALGHQLAHVLFDRDPLDDLFAERRADRMGAVITANAGFQVSGMVGYWEDAARWYPWLITPERGRPAWTNNDYGRFRYLARRYQHQDIARRMQGMRDVVADIERQQAAAAHPK